jgi:hypothetical protein
LQQLGRPASRNATGHAGYGKFLGHDHHVQRSAGRIGEVANLARFNVRNPPETIRRKYARKVLFTSIREGIPMADAAEPVASFETDIKPLFRESDRAAMLRSFDLWSLDDVRAHAQQIAEQLQAGTMPCDGAWPTDDVTKFADWVSSGAHP